MTTEPSPPSPSSASRPLGQLVGPLFAGAVTAAIGGPEGWRWVFVLLSLPLGLLAAWARLLRDRRRGQYEQREVLGEVLSVDDADVPVIQVRNLDVSYGPVQVLFGCGLDVRRGESLAVLGANGAGKTTLLRAVVGLMLPDRGVVRLHGRTITYSEAEYRFARGIVAVRGGDGIFPGLSVRENLELSLSTLDLGRQERRRRIAGATEVFPFLEERLGAVAGDLSGGQRQQLALARALVHEPEVLLIDELSLGLAPIVVQSLIEVVERLRERGQTMILVEQSTNIALSVCDRAVYLEKGRVVFEGAADELRRRPDLVEAVFAGSAANGGVTL